MSGNGLLQLGRSRSGWKNDGARHERLRSRARWKHQKDRGGLAAERLSVSTSLIHVWIQHGVLASEQRTTQSDRWVRLTEADILRLDG